VTNDGLLFRRRLQLFARASQVGVSRACRERGMKDSRNNRGGCRGDARFVISDCFVN